MFANVSQVNAGFLLIKKNNIMDIFKSKIEKLTSKITEENLRLLDVSERNSEYYLEKLFAWQDEYEWVDWEEFKDYWTYCERCKGYSEGSCICYAR
jgi:hypothetical protein